MAGGIGILGNMGAEPQGTGILGGLHNFAADNSGSLIGMGLGLMSGDMGQASQGYMQGQRQDTLRRDNELKQQQYQQLQSVAMTRAQEMGIDPKLAQASPETVLTMWQKFETDKRTPKTPQLIGSAETGYTWATPGQQLPEQFSMPSTSKAPTTKNIKQQDGSEVVVQWDGGKREWVPMPAPAGGAAVSGPVKLTESQSKDVGFYSRGIAIAPRLDQQDEALTSNLSKHGGNISNYLKSDEYRQAEQTGREFLAVILRKDTGAAVTPPEFEMYGQIYLPAPGDDAATIRQKRQSRKTALEGIKKGLGTAEVLFQSQKEIETAKRGGGAAPAGAVDHLRKNPNLRREFDAKYGPGSSARALGIPDA